MSLTREQQLLIDEIINKGYDSDEFQDYVCQVRPDKGDDLEKWSYVELVKVIEEFKAKKSEKSQIFQENLIHNEKQKDKEKDPSPKQQEIDGFQIIDEQVYEQVTQQQEERIRINDKISLDPFCKTIKCKPQQYFIEDDIELQFTVHRPLEERGGFFSFYKKAIVFPIEIYPMQWKVKRTLQDFIQLRKILSFEFPEFLIPTFPEIDAQDFAFIEKQQEPIMKVIKNFLEMFNNTKVLRQSFSALLFLNETNVKHFTTKLYDEIKLTKAYNLNNKQKRNQQIELNFSKQNFQQCREYESFIQNDYQHYDQIEKYLDYYITHITKGCDYLNHMQIQMQKLYQSLPTFGDGMDFGNQLLMLKNYIATIKDQQLREVHSIKDTIQSVLIKCSNSKVPLMEIKANLNECQQNFINEYNTLNKRKEEVFIIKDLNKWGIAQDKIQTIDQSKAFFNLAYAKSIMFQKDSSVVQDKLDQYVYMMQWFQRGVNHIFKSQKKALTEHMNIYLETMVQYSIKRTEQWSNFKSEYETSVSLIQKLEK